MSVEATSVAWARRDLGSTEKLILVRIADHAGPEGRDAYPSLARLSADTGLSRRAVQSAIRRLEAKDALAVTYKGGPGGCNRYAVSMAVPQVLDSTPPEPTDGALAATSEDLTRGGPDTVQEMHGAPAATTYPQDGAPAATSPGSSCTVQEPHSAAGARDGAAPAPLPGSSCTQNRKEPLEPSSSSSSSDFTTPPDDRPDEEEEDQQPQVQLDDVWPLVARRRLARRSDSQGAPVDPEAWSAEAARRARIDLEAEARRLADAFPTITAAQLAEALDGSTGVLRHLPGREAVA